MRQHNHGVPKCETCGDRARSQSDGHWGCSTHYGLCLLTLPTTTAPLDPDAEAIAFLIHEGFTVEAATAMVRK